MTNNRFLKIYLVLVFFVLFIYGFSNQSLGTLITRIIDHYGINMAQAGLLSSFASTGTFIAIFVVTIFVGRINKIILLGASILFYAASFYAISVAPPYGIILVCFALMGVFATTLDTLTNSLVADLDPENINRNISYLHGFYGLGGLCGPIVMERLAGILSWQRVYFIVSMFYIFYLIIYAALFKSQWGLLTSHLSHKKQARFGFIDIIQFFTQKKHVYIWLVMFFYIGNQITIAVWIKRYVEIRINSAVWGAYALSLMWLGIAISRLIISPLIKSSSHQKICIGNLISGIALSAGLLSGSAPGIIAASLVIGLSSGLTIPLIIATCCEWHPEKTALGTLMPYTAMAISCVLFPPISGLIGDSFGIQWGVAVSSICALLSALFSGILYMSLKSK